MDNPVDLTSLEVLEQMHKDLQTTLYNAVKYGVPKKNRKTGKVTLVKPSVQLMNIARQFTRDNSTEPNKVTKTFSILNKI
jgi:hypothetical protein